jgi:hypothetical protein
MLSPLTGNRDNIKTPLSEERELPPMEIVESKCRRDDDAQLDSPGRRALIA